ncbi:MAG: phosphate acyltransferase PlsX [Candidatus Methylacidiphilales bacterium]
MRIALDAMGGDFAPHHPVAAALQALDRFPSIEKIILVGDEDRLRTELVTHRREPDERLHLYHASQVIEMTDGAVEAVRRKKDSSLVRSIDLVKEGAADAIVSAGHTGALVAASTIKLRNLPGVDRAGIAAILPSATGVFLLIDAGGNVDSRPEHLRDFAIMGSIFCKHIIRQPSPKVGLLSNGTEESKGNELTRQTLPLLKKTPVDFIGYVEGHSLFEGRCDVVVCDGFVGNIVLKCCEDLARSTFGWLKQELVQNPIRMAGAFLARGAFQAIKKRTNPDEYGGALILGVNGVCVKAHGSSSVLAIVNALRVASEAIDLGVNAKIVAEIAQTELLSRN